MKCLETYNPYSTQNIGFQYAPVKFCHSETVAVTAVPPVFSAVGPHSGGYVSIKGDIISRLSHTNTMYRYNNTGIWRFWVPNIEDAAKI